MAKKPKKEQYGLSAKTQRPIRKHLYDADYIQKLSPEEKEWLDRFNREYLNSDFSKSGRDLHKTKKDKKICYDSNNSRNRDLYSRSKARNALYSLEDQDKDASYETEDEIIDKIDKKNESED